MNIVQNIMDMCQNEENFDVAGLMYDQKKHTKQWKDAIHELKIDAKNIANLAFMIRSGNKKVRAIARGVDRRRGDEIDKFVSTKARFFKSYLTRKSWFLKTPISRKKHSTYSVLSYIEFLDNSTYSENCFYSEVCYPLTSDDLTIINRLCQHDEPIVIANAGIDPSILDLVECNSLILRSCSIKLGICTKKFDTVQFIDCYTPDYAAKTLFKKMFPNTFITH